MVFISALRSKISEKNNKIFLQAGGSFGLNLINQCLLLAITAVLTRLLTPDQYGLYAVIWSLMMLLALPIAGGFPVFMIRHLSPAYKQNNYALFKGLSATSFLWILFGTCVLASALFFIFPYIVAENRYAYQAGLGLLILPPLLVCIGSILRSMKYVLWGRFPEFFIQPALFLALCFFVLYSGDTTKWGASNVLMGQSLTYAIALAISALLLFAFLPKETWQAKPTFAMRKWIQSAMPLMFAVGLIVVNNNIDIVMVGALAGKEEAGQYRVASRIAGFVLFFLLAANNAMGPTIAAQHKEGKQKELQSLLTKMARGIFVFSMPVIFIFCLWPHKILDLLFGAPYMAGAMALIILTIANGCSAAMGQAGHIMSIAGKEKFSAYASLIAVVTNIGLNAILIPRFGIEGAAIGTGTSIVLWNILLAYWTVRHTGYHTTILGPMLKRAIK